MQTTAHESQKFSMPVTTLVLALFTIMFVLFTYTFVHESGHALVGLLFGQKLTAFHINFLEWDAYVGMAGNLTHPQRAMQSIAGAGVPLWIWFGLINLAPRRTTFSLELLKLLGSMTVLNTLLVWIIIPILYSLGNAPSDDVTNFLHYSQMPPLILTFIAAVIYARGWALFLSKIDGLRNEFLLFRITDQASVTAGMRRPVTVMAGILMFCIAVTFILGGLSTGNMAGSLIPPPDFEPVAQIDLSNQGYSGELLAEFTLKEATLVGVFVVIRNINTTYFDLSVSGSDGYRSGILHGEGYNAQQDGGLWEKNLQPGTYQVVLTSHQSPGAVSVYLKTH